MFTIDTYVYTIYINIYMYISRGLRESLMFVEMYHPEPVLEPVVLMG